MSRALRCQLIHRGLRCSIIVSSGRKDCILSKSSLIQSQTTVEENTDRTKRVLRTEVSVNESRDTSGGLEVNE